MRQVDVFRRVFEASSVTAAAEALGISQPAVSKHLAALERACGFRLFERRAGRLVQTPEGQLLALEVDRLFENVGRLEHIARDIAERRRGKVRIAAFPALSNRILPAVLVPILADRPQIGLSLETRTSPLVAELVQNQRIDLGFGLLPVEDPHVECTSICSFAMVCVLPHGHRLAERTSVAAADLVDEPFISLGAADRSRTVIDAAFGTELSRSRMQIDAQMAEAACGFVARGLGVTIVPPFVAESFARDGLVSRPFRPRVGMQVWQLVPTGSPVGAVTRFLAAAVRDALEPYSDLRPPTPVHGSGPAI